LVLGRRLAQASIGVLGLCLAGAAGAAVVTAISSSTMALASARPWVVSVSNANGTLYPGQNATMTYAIKNDESRPKVLHATVAEFRNDGVGVYDNKTHRYVDECRATWFRTNADTIPVGAVIAPGASVKGTLDLAMDKDASGLDACQNLGVDVILTAE